MLSTPVGPPPTTTMCRAPSSTSDGSRSAASQRRRTCSLSSHRVGERVHRKGVLGRTLDAEEGDLGADPEDEVVVVDGGHLVELNPAAFQVDRGRGRLVDGGVGLIVKQVA